jgi:cell division protein FtsI/penicillin-binding protein 2
MKNVKFTRSQVLTFGLLLVMLVFVAKLFDIQILQHDKYLAEADDMQVTKATINPVRGQIFVRDRDGNIAPLVLNRTVYTVFADPSSIEKVDEVRQLIATVAGKQIVSDNLDKLSNQQLQYVVLARQVSYQQAQQIRQAKLAGVGLQASSERVYPEGSLAAQTLGFVNADGVGQYGVEQFLNDQLKGQAGTLQSVTDVRHIPLTIGAHDVSIPAKDGQNIVLSIDRNVQLQAEQMLSDGLKNAQATSGSIIVMNPQNGRIMAMANLPTYNPEAYNQVQDAALFQNNVTMNPYEPGSVMKLFTVGAAMDKAVINRDSTFYNTGCVTVDDAKICNVERQVDGQQLTMTQLLQYSLNTGAVWVMTQMGGGDNNLTARQVFYDYLANNFRLNNKTGVEVSGEADSVIFKPNTPNGARVLYANMAFGQGEQLTMVQVISAFSAAINGGKYYQPTVLLGTTDATGSNLQENQPKLIADNVLKPEVSQNLKEMLQQARYLGAGGRYKDNSYYVGGKSGTAQKIDPATGKYSDSLTTGTYIGFGADKAGTPKYAIMVRVDDAHNGGYSGSAAAQPIFDAMSNYMIQYEGISK